LSRPFRTIINGVQEGIDNDEVFMKGFTKSVLEATGELADPFISESIFTEAVTDIIARGGRTRDGKVLYTEETPDGEKYARIFRHIGESQLPQYKQFVRVYDSATGKPDPNGDVIEIDKALGGVYGFRMIKLRPDKAMQYYVADYQESERNARREFTGGPEGVLKVAKTPEEVIERYFVANKALFDVHRKMRRHIKNARQFMTEDKLFEIFRKRGLKGDFNYLTENTFDPFYPSRNLQQKFEEISTSSGQPNPFVQAEPVISRMRDSFERKSLNDPDFGFKLEDFLPSAAPQAQAPLPEQPMPNPQIVASQPTVMQTGLTPTEQALLSEEEKVEVGKVLGFKDEETAAKDVEIIAEQATKEENVATAVEEYVDRAIENKDVENYTLADVVTEVQVEAFISDPVGAIMDIDLENINLSDIGNDMTSDQKEKAQEVVVPVIIASQIIAQAGALIRRPF